MDPKELKAAVDALLKEKKVLDEKQKHIYSALESLQAICSHDFQSVGHTSHDNIEKCTVCGRQIRV